MNWNERRSSSFHCGCVRQLPIDRVCNNVWLDDDESRHFQRSDNNALVFSSRERLDEWHRLGWLTHKEWVWLTEECIVCWSKTDRADSQSRLMSSLSFRKYIFTAVCPQLFPSIHLNGAWNGNSLGKLACHVETPFQTRQHLVEPVSNSRGVMLA